MNCGLKAYLSRMELRSEGVNVIALAAPKYREGVRGREKMFNGPVLHQKWAKNAVFSEGVKVGCPLEGVYEFEMFNKNVLNRTFQTAYPLPGWVNPSLLHLLRNISQCFVQKCLYLLKSSEE